ncbi:hypothetical protein [Microscilla marina]|uniref:hypothetical protein n=1 Tax=Microscilla marina TaxID=1027 RepID=UPI0012FA4DBC|nr:hypothetical protein [Microscilla marina]
MKNSFESFTDCELSESQLALTSGGKCPCPEDPGGSSDAGNNTTSGGAIYYYYY